MIKVKCVIDNKKFNSKPEGFEVGAIINRMTIDTAGDYSVEEIKEKILKGFTVRPSYCGGKEDSWISQQVFMIDIDNKPSKPKGMKDEEYQVLCEQYLKENHRTYNDIINHCKSINLIPAFIYTSFNHKDNWHKVRLVFVLDKAITDINTAKKIQLYLMVQISDVDEQCKNINRIYYAGKDIVFDSGNIIDSDRLIELSKDIEVISKKKDFLSKACNNGGSGERVNNILNTDFRTGITVT